MFPDIQGRIRIENISEFLFTGPEAPPLADSDDTRITNIEDEIGQLLKTAIPGEDVGKIIGAELFDLLQQAKNLSFELGLRAGASLVFELLGLRRIA